LVHAQPAAPSGTRRLGRTDPSVDLPDLALEIYHDGHDERHIELCDEHRHDGGQALPPYRGNMPPIS
jgi:hypothetical protein